MSNPEPREPYSEIDLIDVWIILRRHRWLFIIVFLVVFILGTVAAALHTTKYDYTTVVSIGTLQNVKTGAVAPIMTPDAVMATLQNAIIPDALHTYTGAHPGFNPASINIQVRTSQAGALLILQARGTLAQDTLLRGILAHVVSKMTQETESPFQARIIANKKLLTQQIEKLESQQTALEKSRQYLITKGDRTDKAFTLLVMDNQIEMQQQQLLSLKQQLDDVALTQVIAPPQHSVNPAGLGKAALVAISFVLAILLALFAVFLVHMKMLASQRTASGS